MKDKDKEIQPIECTDCGYNECVCECTYGSCELGYVRGSDLGELLWFDEENFYQCPSCKGTGLKRKMTLW